MITLILFMIGASGNFLLGQNDHETPTKKQKVRMTLSYTNMNNNGSRLMASAKAKIDRSYVGVENLKIHFYHDTAYSENYFGSMITDENGEANFPIPETFRKPLKYDSAFHFIAEFEGNENYKAAAKSIDIQNAISKLTFLEIDSTPYIEYFVGIPLDSAKSYLPVADVEVRIFVKRLFGLLPISEEFAKTNDEGKLLVKFPDDIYGDEKGDVTIVGKVIDHDMFGNLHYSHTIPWGIPVSSTSESWAQQSWSKLWSTAANAPFSLVVSVMLLISAVWLTILYVTFQTARIRNLGSSN